MPNLLKVDIIAGYNGTIKIRGTMEDGEHVIIDANEAETLLASAVIARGFSLSRAPRQQYNRVVLNK